MVDRLPELLKLFFFKALIQRIIQNLRFIAVLKHLLQQAVVIDCLYQSMNTFFNRLQSFRDRCKGVVLDIIPVILRYAIFLINIIVANEVLVNCSRLPVIHLNRLTVDLKLFFTRA